MVKQFINPELLAPNVLTVPVDSAIVDEFGTLADLAGDDDDYAIIKPPWPSDVGWISPRTEATFAPFEQAFERLGIADHVTEYVDVDEQVRMYAGFLVVRSECEATAFHVDWEKTGNQAFTVLTPIGDPVAGFGLNYRRLDGTTGDYDYRRGEAILFGDHFMHSTRPGRSDRPMALLCFTFGTDRMDDWHRIRATAAYQGELVRRPDGQFERSKA